MANSSLLKNLSTLEKNKYRPSIMHLEERLAPGNILSGTQQIVEAALNVSKVSITGSTVATKQGKSKAATPKAKLAVDYGTSDLGSGHSHFNMDDCGCGGGSSGGSSIQGKGIVYGAAVNAGLDIDVDDIAIPIPAEYNGGAWTVGFGGSKDGGTDGGSPGTGGKLTQFGTFLPSNGLKADATGNNHNADDGHGHGGAAHSHAEDQRAAAFGAVEATSSGSTHMHKEIDNRVDLGYTDNQFFMDGGQLQALNDMIQVTPSMTVRQNTAYGIPSMITNSTGFVTGAQAGTSREIVSNWLVSNATLLGIDPAEVPNLIVKKDYTDNFVDNSFKNKNKKLMKSTIPELSRVQLQQQHNGIPVWQADVVSATMPDGSIISVGNRLIPGLANSINAVSPIVTPADAVAKAAESLDEELLQELMVLATNDGPQQGVLYTDGGISRDAIPVKLVYLPITRGETRLMWNVVINETDSPDWMEINVDALTGTVWTKSNWTRYDSYQVFAFGSRSPSDGAQKIVTNPADPIASPTAWHSIDADPSPEFFDTRGNNAIAQEDRNDSNNGGNRPQGGIGNNYKFRYNPTGSAIDNGFQATTQAFYMTNVWHDVMYHFGFTEAAGNFQFDNLGRGGLGNDPVAVDEADNYNGDDFCNASMATPADGGQPRMELLICPGLNGEHSAANDSEVLFHELTHGLTGRMSAALGGDPSQSGAMGEGWSDWYALMLTAQQNDPSKPVATRASSTRGAAGWYFGAPDENNLPDGTSDSRGLRRFMYSTVSRPEGINQAAWAHLGAAYDQRQIGPPSNQLSLRYSQIDPADDVTGFQDANQVHNAGEIWANTLWDLAQRFQADYGFDKNLYNGTASNKGNTRVLTLVTEALTLNPSRPTFLDARDAILAADRALYKGGNQFKIWSSFAKYGMGQFADDDGTDVRYHVQDDFTIPDGVSDGEDGGDGGDGGGGGGEGGQNDNDYEPNDFSDKAYNLGNVSSQTIEGLAIQKRTNQDRDWFRFTLNKSGSLTVKARMDDSAGDLDPRIYSNQNGILKELARSTKRRDGGNESVTINGKSNVQYLVQIIGYKGDSGNYDLQFIAP